MVTRQTISRLLKKFQETNSLEYHPHPGRPSKLNEVHVNFIDEKMHGNDESNFQYLSEIAGIISLMILTNV